MRYLITGATGLLGNNIVRQLAQSGESVRVLARSHSDPRPLAGLGVERFSGDVRDADSVSAACQGIDVVIHSAGHVQIGWRERDLHQAINVEGTRNVAAAARAAGARLVHVSTINALGVGCLANPPGEDGGRPGAVECPYVATKRAAEQVVREEVGRGLWAVIVNLATMFGPWDWKPSSGRMLLAVAQGPLFAPTGATGVGDVRDVAAATIAAAARGVSGQRYILAGHNLSYRQIWLAMARVAGRRGPRLPMGPVFRAVALPALGVRSWFVKNEGEANSAALLMSRQEHCFSSRRAEEELGFSVRPMDETLADTWSWFREHGYV